MTTPVCAHITLGPWTREHATFPTIGDAVAYFRSEVAGIDYGTGTDEQAMNLYPRCSECTDDMCFHDYPMAVYTVGPRGGIRREA